MRVLQINSVYGSGSTGRITADIHSMLLNEGSDSYVAYGRGSSNDHGTIKIGKKIDSIVHGLMTRVFDNHGLASKKATDSFIRKIKDLDFQIVHLHNIHGYYINIESLFQYLKSLDVPIVWTLHDCWSFTGHCTYFDYMNCNKWETKCYDCPQKAAYPSSVLIDRSKKNFLLKKELFNGLKNLTIVTPSIWLSNLVKKSFLKNYPVKVINNGVDTDIFKPNENTFRQKYALGKKFIILGVASVWEPRKGFKYFIELSHKISTDEVIVLVGLNNELINDLPCNIIGISKTENINQLAEIYSGANVFFNPTLEDNFPTTNLEALACGTPVITFNTGGSVESVNEDCGFIIEKGNIEDVLSCINIVKKKDEKHYTNICRARALQLFEKKERYSEYLTLYKELIN